jgi:outer membrane protein assembly factor BamE (lipoprotein component of BamABCDE complex)
MFIFQNIKNFSALALPCLLLALSGCVSKTDKGGFVNDLDIANEVIVGQTTRDEVVERIGSPSSKSTFGNESWYYISDSIETVAFFKPEITDQRVTRIEFDQAGVVTNVQQLSKKDRLEFDTVNRTTPTEGHSMTIMEQLLGNVGRFNSPGSVGGPTRRPGSVPGGAPGGF